MGACLSSCWTPTACSFIQHEDKRQIWSLMSTSSDQYVCMTDGLIDDSTASYLVKASGSAAIASSKIIITFKNAGSPDNRGRQWFYMTFASNNKTYYMTGTTAEVKAVDNSNSDGNSQIWLPVYMTSPNVGYYALQSKSGGEENLLFLSSNGEGELKLKPPNSTAYPPPYSNPFIDVDLLFRFAEPGQAL